MSSRVQLFVLFAAWLVAAVEEAHALDDMHAGRTLDRRHAPHLLHAHGDEAHRITSPPPPPPPQVGFPIGQRGPGGGPPGMGGPGGAFPWTR